MRCLAAASVFALSLAWTSAESIAKADELRVHVESVAVNAPAQSASDLLMSLTLKGYDVFSVGQFQAALQEADLLVSAVQVPDMLASLRSLELGAAHEAAATALLEFSASSQPAAASMQIAQQPIQVDLDLQVAALTCDTANPDDCAPETDSQNQGRGVENYSG